MPWWVGLCGSATIVLNGLCIFYLGGPFSSTIVMQRTLGRVPQNSKLCAIGCNMIKRGTFLQSLLGPVFFCFPIQRVLEWWIKWWLFFEKKKTEVEAVWHTLGNQRGLSMVLTTNLRVPRPGGLITEKMTSLANRTSNSFNFIPNLTQHQLNTDPTLTQL